MLTLVPPKLIILLIVLGLTVNTELYCAFQERGKKNQQVCPLSTSFAQQTECVKHAYSLQFSTMEFAATLYFTDANLP